ncbi:Uncharacterised protein [Bordetella pertussis]|nr:Uncharacterised protein [Bordetella pertussis]CFN10572.1 Uncharacterised protein [Bordetella pertussis]CFU11052.1 Uncharacterised protein [Bordetella pertussis]CFU59671.1 Uncharacterised protein [Bordetella pertussis]CFW20901.1 Uncharacterised protein [Bordetella pertussis]
MPASSSTRASSALVSGVKADGLSTTALPAAKAGATLCSTVFKGALNGVIAATTPTGTRTVNPSLCSAPGLAWNGTMLPVRRSASSADSSSVTLARVNSAEMS